MITILAETAWYEGMGEFIQSLEGIKTIIMSVSGASILVLVYKIIMFLRFTRSKDFDNWLFYRIMNFVENLENEKHRNRILHVITIVKQLPFANDLYEKVRKKSREMSLELEGRLYDVEAKIKSGMFEGEELQRLIDYKAKLIDENNR